MRTVLPARAVWVLIIAIIVQNASCLEALDDVAELQDPDLSHLLGEADAAPAKLEEQNQQLQGAISAIEQGVPPPGMEQMMGGAPSEEAAEGGEVGGAAPDGEAAPAGAPAGGALSEGIKMAMKSVKPLMDKYVSTARALTNKYALLKKKYLLAKSQIVKCPTEEELQAREDAAVKLADTKSEAKLAKSSKEYEAEIAQMKAESEATIEGLTVDKTKLQEYIKTNKEQFKVELAAAKEKAQSAVEALQGMLKKTMLAELKKRDNAIELDKKASVKERIAKDLAEKDEKVKEREAKRNKHEKVIAKEKADKAKEKIRKAEEAKEAKIKQAASEEMRNINRDSVMLKVSKAVDEARKAGRMARKMAHDADTNLENARITKARKVTEDDIKALSKLRHHQDLATVAVDSAKEKREKISKYEYTAKDSLAKSEHRMVVLKKKSRWEKRHVDTMKDIAARARDKAERLRVAAQTAAKSAGFDAPSIPITDSDADAADTKIEAAHDERSQARAELQRAGVPIPPGLKKGEMSLLKKKMQNAEQNADESASEEDKVAKVKKHDQVETAKMKTNIARTKLATATVKRQAARDALKAEGQEIPETLKKGGLDVERDKLEKAAESASAAAEQLEAEEGGSKSKKMELARAALSKAEDASLKREAAREELEKEDKPVPAELEKGGMDEVKREAKEDLDAAQAEKSPTDKQDNDSKKTKAVKNSAKANEALLRAEQAGAKVSLARSFRKKARDALKEEGKEVPEELTKGAFDETAKRAEAAIEKAKALNAKVGSQGGR
jgi:hypothetical protein